MPGEHGAIKNVCSPTTITFVGCKMPKNPKQHLKEEYLTVKELSEKIKFSKHSLYNLIHKGTFVLGKHYLKPTPKKVLFKWTKIREWMGEPLHSQERPDTKNCSYESVSGSSDRSAIKKSPSLINI